MASGQLSSQIAGSSRQSNPNRKASWFSTFVRNRAREAGYGAFFASVFLLCQSPANALVIDDIRVLSKLGEPFVAQIVVTPAAGEVLNRGCFSTTRSSGDLPDLGTVRLALTRSLGSSVLRISGSQPVREPLSEFVLQVKCPGVPTMVKTFLVMVDPPTDVTTRAVTPTTVNTPVTATIRPNRAVTNPAYQSLIPPGSRYMVRAGDTLSTIASRVANRPDWSVWPIAQKIYATNPGAFLLGDPNVIAQGAVIFVPQLADVDMNLASAPVRPAAGTTRSSGARANPVNARSSLVTQDNGTRPQPAVIAVTPDPIVTPQPVAIASINGRSQIMPTPPTVVTTPPTPLPAMQLTARLLDESKIKILLRAQGSPVMAAVATQKPLTETPVSTSPEPQTEPERPDSAATDNRAVLQPGQTAQINSKLNWLWILVGLFTGLLIGALAAVSLFRRNLRHEYEHDVLDAVQRQLQIDRLRQLNQPVPGAAETSQTASITAATMDLDDTTDTAAEIDHTIEMSTVQDMDFDLSSTDEPAKTGSPETLEMPGIGSKLDLDLPAQTGKTGQHEVDFDLLEAAYSEDYQTEFVNQADTTEADTTDVSDTAEPGDDTNRYYHLENRDPTDERPLPIELGEDEMGDDDGEPDSKVVRFRR